MALEFIPTGTTGAAGRALLNPRFNVVAVTYAATINTNASLGSTFDITLTGNPALANPTLAKDGQAIKWRLRASGADRLVTPGSKFRDPRISGALAPFTVPSGTKTILAVIYDLTDDKFDVVSLVEGY